MPISPTLNRNSTQPPLPRPCQHPNVTTTDPPPVPTVAAPPSGAADALVLEAPRRLVRRRLPLAPVRPGEGRLRVEACGLCGTDHELYTGALPWPAGFVPGHETVGVIEELGAGAAERWGVAVGDRVAVASRQACRTCPSCLAGDLSSCPSYGPTDSYGLSAAPGGGGLWGGYATHHHLAADTVLHPVPDGLDAVTATLFNPVGAGVAWAVDLPETSPGDVVVVLGPGIRGIAAVVAAKAAGASFVAITGAGGRDAGRLETARRAGADLALDVLVDDPVEAVRQATGGLADVVVDVTANAPAAFGQALELAGRGGRVVVAGIRGGEVTATFSPDLIPVRGLRVLGASGVSTAAHRRALELVASGAFPVDAVDRRVAGFDDVGQLLADMAGEGGPPPLHAVFSPLA
jgi:alcohol dehydrogenase